MGNPTVKIYLTNWQMRMVQDFLHTPCEALEISVDSSANHKYGVKSNITDREVEHKRMYLTNWQIDQIKLQIGGLAADLLSW